VLQKSSFPVGGQDIVTPLFILQCFQALEQKNRTPTFVTGCNLYGDHAKFDLL